MQSPDIPQLTHQVLWAALALSMVFGAVAQRTHFCTMGAVSDIVNMGDWTRMRQWALAAGVAVLGFGALVFSGRIDPSSTLYASNRWLWLSALVGGGMFGFGMVLASGCGSKTLVRIGGGSLKAVVVFVVMAVAAGATLRGITAVVRVATVDPVSWQLGTQAALPQLLAPVAGWGLPATSLALGLVVGGALVGWALVGDGFVRAGNLLAGLGIGAVLVAMWWVSGHLGHVAEHPETLQEAFVGTYSGRIEALSFVAPYAHALDWLMFFSDNSRVLTLGIVSVVGVVAGSAVVALASHRFRWEGFGGPGDLANHLCGAVLMGVGGVTAMGCTIGQGLSGLSTLSLTSFVALAAILAGAVAALRYQHWRLERSA
ncbi:YeeE/YedE family protein [Pseudorhodoferax sp. Leaf274]|uniref:YeeE/YedE family protein n=1 Tax=Pseudorhodoferax sp. Leaf274 TaxID=1736318 RepID=UPI00070357C7|nr:YeeE/YedE family protein [Pseudorhodoferax sp. Leaf274]KQP38901.1 transporter [Pseudorhodoferax sp. Leaf274]